jgi:hypothetical protein
MIVSSSASCRGSLLAPGRGYLDLHQAAVEACGTDAAKVALIVMLALNQRHRD